jgi:hypothetical protein
MSESLQFLRHHPGLLKLADTEPAHMRGVASAVTRWRHVLLSSCAFSSTMLLCLLLLPQMVPVMATVNATTGVLQQARFGLSGAAANGYAMFGGGANFSCALHSAAYSHSAQG